MASSSGIFPEFAVLRLIFQNAGHPAGGHRAQVGVGN
jgi:hypothetical protein